MSYLMNWVKGEAETAELNNETSSTEAQPKEGFGNSLPVTRNHRIFQADDIKGFNLPIFCPGSNGLKKKKKSPEIRPNVKLAFM